MGMARGNGPGDGKGETMNELGTRPRRKKPYATPRLVDFGTIVEMTDGCSGFCIDGESGGMTWLFP